MFRYLKKLFGAKPTTKRPASRRRLTVTALESRDLLNAGPAFIGAHAFAFGLHSHGGPALTPPAVSYSGQLDDSGGAVHAQTLTANLSGVTGASGTVTFAPTSTAGQNTFTASVSGLTANTTYTVQVGNGTATPTTLGNITTDANGSGSLSLSNVTGTVAAGSVVTVVDNSTTPGTTVLSGTLATSGGCHTGQELSTALTGTTGSGFARLNAGRDRLSVRVSGLTADTTYTVQVASGTATPTMVGSFTTDAEGNGRLRVSDLTTTITAGTAIDIVDPTGATVLSGTFSTPSASDRWWY